MPFDLFSVDDHIIEHARVWTDRLPAKYHDTRPRVIEDDGREYWVWEGYPAHMYDIGRVLAEGLAEELFGDVLAGDDGA